MLKEYYALAKPGLVYGNLITVIAGFLVGERIIINVGGATPSIAPINFIALFAVVIGIAFVMASGCVFNNVIDRRIDAAMPRTRERALVTGKISRHAAISYSAALGLIGFATLALGTNPTATAAAALGWLAYVILYSTWAKLRTIHAVEVGSIAGAIPPVVGYTAAIGAFTSSIHIDLGAALLFIIIALWQIPHFYSIAIYRLDDYRAGGVPVLPARKGIPTTKRAILSYTIAFAIATILLAVLDYADTIYLTAAIVVSGVWLGYAIKGFYIDKMPGGDATADKRWARHMFFISLIAMAGLFLTLAVTSLAR